MKKTYIAPSVETFEVQASSLMAQSLTVSDTQVDTSTDGVQLGREENTSTGTSLWDQEW